MSVSEPVRLAFLGDVRLPVLHASHVADPFILVRPWLDQADLVLANLEGPIGQSGVRRPGRTAILHNDPSVLASLARFPRCLVSLANNHIMDYGREGLARTLRLLDEHSLLHVGAGFDETTANSPVFVKVRKTTVAFLSLTTDEPHVGAVCASGEDAPGAGSWQRRQEALRMVRDLSQTADVVCVILHWGCEFFEYPMPSQIEDAVLLAEAGADLIICHHPHIVQGIQRIGDTLVAYSLGNCVFPPFEIPNGRVQVQSKIEREFMLLKCVVQPGQPTAFSTLAGRVTRRFELRPYGERAARHFDARLRRLSAPLGGEDYNRFYQHYSVRRTRQLRWGAILHAFRKLNPATLKTLRLEDLRRQWNRLLLKPGS